jgi:hypothetical protein
MFSGESAAVRIAVSSRSFRRPLASGELTQLEWVERCASELHADGILSDIADFPRTDPDYVAQLRKVAVDLGLVPFGIDVAPLLDPPADLQLRDSALALAGGLGALVVRTALPAPGEIPPKAFVETVAVAKGASRAAKALNLTILVESAPGTLGPDLESVKHLLKDVDSAWLRACPRAVRDAAALGPKDRTPAWVATTADDPARTAQAAVDGWLILDADEPHGTWEAFGTAVRALRIAEARIRLT